MKQGHAPGKCLKSSTSTKIVKNWERMRLKGLFPVTVADIGVGQLIVEKFGVSLYMK